MYFGRAEPYRQDTVFSQMFVYETLAKTLVDLGADYVGIYDPYGYNLVPYRQAPTDPFIAGQFDEAYGFLLQTRPEVGAKFTDRALKLLAIPPRTSRIVMAVLPGALVIAHMSSFESWASDVLARKLADAIETWVAESQNPCVPRRPSWLPPLPQHQPDLTRFREDLSRLH
jgi:hypothetical protein